MTSSSATNILRRVLKNYRLLTPRGSLLNVLPNTPTGYGPFRILDDIIISAYPGNSSDHVVKSLFWLGSFDPWVCSTIKLLYESNTSAIDIGANIGLMTIVMSKLAGTMGRVYAFEPAPDTLDRLTINISANKLQNVEVFNLAVSNSRGYCRLVLPDGQQGMARIDQNDSADKSIQVPMITFDEWASSRELGPISVCKIDVEGHEPQVFDGMSETLRSGMIGSIIFEDHATPAQSLTQKALARHDFEIFRIHKTSLKAYYLRIGQHGPGKVTADYVAARIGSSAFRKLTDAR